MERPRLACSFERGFGGALKCLKLRYLIIPAKVGIQVFERLSAPRLRGVTMRGTLLDPLQESENRETRMGKTRTIVGWVAAFFLLVFAHLGSASPAAATTTGGTLSQDEVWSGTVQVTEDVTVPQGITLTVSPGTIVQFTENTGLFIEGKLLALGSPGNRITFTALSPLPKEGIWDGIHFEDSSREECSISHATIEYAARGVWYGGPGMTIRSSTFFRNGVGIQLVSLSASMLISDCIITESPQEGIAGFLLEGGQVRILNNHIARSDTGISVSGRSDALELIIRNNIVRDNQDVGIRVDSVYSTDIRFNTVLNNAWGMELTAGHSTSVASSNILAWNICGLRLVPGGGTYTLSYNGFWRNGYDYWGISAGEDHFSQDPLFAGMNDFHLQPGSPCIDAGDPSVSDPDGSRSDMGAYGVGGDPPREEGDHRPDTPFHVLPLDGGVLSPPAWSLEASPFLDRDPGDIHEASRWQIYEMPREMDEYPTLVHDSWQTGEHLTVLPIPRGILDPSRSYIWQVRYKDSRNGWSVVSEKTAFTTAEDTEPPDTLITSGPDDGSHIGSKSVSFTIFAVDDYFRNAFGAYSYSMDGTENWSPFDSSRYLTFNGLSEGPHTLYVKARDSGGNVDPTPAVRHFIVDTIFPEISNVEVSEITHTGAVISWETSESATSKVVYGTSVNYGSLTAQDERLVTLHEVALENLDPDTVYLFSVRSKDPANHEKIASVLTFRTTPVEDRAPPDVQFSSGPEEGSLLTSRNITLAWTGWDDVTASARLTYAIRLDSGDWSSFSSSTSWTSTDLSDGRHTLEVTARDQAGKTDPTPASRSFTIDTTFPEPASGFMAQKRILGVDLAWQPSPSWDVRSYNLYWDAGGPGGIDYATPHATIAPPIDSISINLPGRGTYHFGLRTVDQAGNEEKNTHLVASVALTRPDAPTLDPVLSPTTATTQVLQGGKDADTSVWLNGVEVIPLNGSTVWSLEVSLSKGVNLFEFSCRNAFGDEGPSVSAAVEHDPPPFPVSTLRVQDRGTGTDLGLDWTGYDEAGQGDIQFYRIYASDQPFSQVGGLTPQWTVGAGVFTHNVDHQERGKTRHFAVVAVDRRGNASSVDGSVSATPTDRIPPEDVTALRVQCFSHRLLFTWNESADTAGDLAGYKVRFNGGSEAVLIPAGQVSFDAVGLLPASSHSIQVTSLDVGGNESSGAFMTGITLLENPEQVMSKPLDGRISLSWAESRPREYVAHYCVYVSESPFTTVSGMTPRTKTAGGSAGVAGLTNGTNYYLAVTAVNLSGGETKDVVPVQATPQGDREGPTISGLTFDNAPLTQGAILGHSGTFRLTATDPAGVSRVEFLVDDALRHTDSNGSGSYSFPWNILSVEDGSHVLTVKASDTLGNHSTVGVNLQIQMDTPGIPVITAPSPGAVTNKDSMAVSGRVDKAADVVLFVNNVQTGGPASLDGNGRFSTSLALVEGENRIQAAGRNRSGNGPKSAPILVHRDSSLPRSPQNLSAELVSGRAVRLTWRAPSEAAIRGYNVYRATTPFSVPSGAAKINTGLIPVLSFQDSPPQDGSYVYRASTVDWAGNESELSNAATIAVDRTPPRAVSIEFHPTGAMDPQSGRIGPGLVNLRLRVSEPLLALPFLSITPRGGAPIAVDLTRESDLEYSGHFTISESTPSGTAQVVFSSRDMAGNRGTEIDSGATLVIDAGGPAVTEISLQPSQPVRNDESHPVSMTVQIGLSEPVREGETPELSYLLSGGGRSPVAVSLLSSTASLPGEAQRWEGAFTLPPDAGLSEVENLRFSFRGADDLGNVGTRILCENRFQVYQGELPPLEPPRGLTGTPLPGGQVRLSWQPVEGACDYQLARRGPGEAALSVFVRPGMVPEFIDTPPSDGAYSYTVASVRRENGQEAVSGMSGEVVVESDSIAPNSPRNLALELTSRGINCIWQPPADLSEKVTYSLYRADLTEITSSEGLTPIIRSIQETTVLDPHPSISDHCYVVTAVDGAGNESLPSNSFYLNFGLLPVSSLKVVQTGLDPPVLSWTPPGGSGPGAIAGYKIQLISAGSGMPLNEELVSGTSFKDTGFSEDERHYTVAAVDGHGMESPGRSIVLPLLQVALKAGETLKRGVMNRLEVVVENRSALQVDHARLKVRIGSHSGVSEEFTLEGGESRVVGVPFGGYADLQDIAELVTTLSIAPRDGELVEIVRTGEVEVDDSTHRLQILNDELTRGGAGRVRFVLENTGEEEIEILTATNWGASSSRELTFTLEDPDGNVLSSRGYRQSLGADVVTLANGATVARIQPGALFTSGPVELPVPLSAPDRVIVRMDVARTHFHLGSPEHAEMQGISSSHEVSLLDTPYSGEVTGVSPESSNGDQDIEISGVAREKATGLLVGEVPLKLVISVNGFDRSYSLLTDAGGRFRFTFVPLALECGRYTVFAVHPDVLDKPSQAGFTIHRLTIAPRTLSLHLPKNFEKIVPLQVSTGDGTRVRNVRLSCDEVDQPNGALPTGVHVTPGPAIPELGSRQSSPLVFSVWADNTADSTSAVVLKLKSDEQGEGSWETVQVNLAFSDSQPALFATPSHMETGVSLGGTASESLTLENRGLADLNEVSLTLVSADGSPAPPWVRLHSESNQGNMAVGEKRSVGLSLTPTDERDEGNHLFYLRVTSTNHLKVDIPLLVAVTQSGIGNALFKVSDIYTGTINTRGQIVQGLAGASITVQNEEVPTIQKTLPTDTLGETLFTGLPAGRYKVRTTAPNHQENIGRIWVKPGLTMSDSVFLAYNLVTVEWEVVETTIRDRYEIVLKATFETNVPAPVVVAEPSSVYLPKMKAGEVFQGELALTNYGLIQAGNVQFTPPDGQDAFHYELLTPVPLVLKARERVSIPFRITCLRSFDPPEDEGGDGGGCARYARWGKLTYDYVCAAGTTVGGSYPTCVIHEVGTCVGKPSLPGPSGGSGGGNSTWFFSFSGSGGTEGPKPGPSPQPMSGVRCWPRAARMEEWTGLRDQCVPETKQDIFQEVGSSVNCLLREYNDGASDLSVKVPGGNGSVLRTFFGDRWHFEDQRHNLKFIMDPMGQTIQYIDKGGVLYEKSSLTTSPPCFTHGTYRITQTESGYLWEDKLGNWRSFESGGKMTAYGNSNGVLTGLLYDPAQRGRLVGLSDRDGRQIIWFEYDAVGNIGAVRDLDGRRVEYGYSGSRLISVKDILGSTTTYAYDDRGRMIQKTDPLGRRETITYDRYGDVSGIVDGDGHGYSFRFDYDKGRTEYYAQIRTPSGMVKEVWYDRNGETRRVDVDGRTTRKIVKDGRHLIITDEAGNVTRKEFDDRMNLTRVVHPDGSTLSYEYDHKLNRPVKVTDERGTVTRYAYDHAGNVLLKTEAAGTDSERTTTFAYDDRGNVVLIRGEGDENTQEADALFEYDGWGNLLSITEPEGAVTRFTHDSMGNVLTRTDPAGKVFSFTYDDAGRMTSVVDPLGHKTKLFHDAVGNRTRIIDAEEKTTKLEYDAHDRLVKTVDPAGGTTLYQYNEAGLLTRRTDAESKVLDYEYDSRGRLTAAVDGNGNVIRLEYADNLGCSSCRGGFDQPARIVTPTFVKELKYDSRGRRIEEKEVLSETESAATRFQYDRAGNVTAVVDKDSRTTQFGYDALGRLSEVKGPLGKVARYLYDDRDSLIALVDANGSRMRFEYDRNNRLIREIRPMGQETSYQYDGRGLLARQADPKNQVAFYGYDDAGRLGELRTYGSLDHTHPVKTVSFVHDRVGNLKSYDDGVTSARYEYDDAHRRIFESVSYGHFQLSSTTGWYSNGRKRSFTGPDGVTYSYDYDGNNQLSSIEIPGRGFMTYNQYSWFGPTKVTLPGGMAREVTYDPLMRLKTLQVKDPAGTVLMAVAHSYDPMGRLISKHTEDGDTRYNYDELHRLIQAGRTGRQPEKFSYDGAGNRLSADDVRGSWSYNANHELQGHETATFSHDRNGNMEEQISGGVTLRTIHNVEDQLERVETGDGAVIAEYGYDPFGRRLWKDVGGRRTYFFYADEGLVGEYNAAGGEIRSYGYRPGSAWTTDPLFMKEGAEYYYYHNDHLGTPMMLTTGSGRVVWSASYTVFGEADVAPLSSVTNNLRFAGQYHDHETGFHYNFHRTYHPGLGRYLEPDPLGAAGGPNPYAYVLDPTNGIDPLGLFAVSWGAVGEGMAGTAVGLAMGAAAVTAGVFLAPAVLAAIPCVVVSSVAVVGAGYLGWRTGQVITGERIDFSLSDWQFHVRRMCDEEGSRMLGEVLVEWGTFGLSALKGLNFCFAAGTPVMTDNGLVAIEWIEVGDRVLSRDEKTGEIVYHEVVRLFETPDQPVYELRLSNTRGESESIHATGDHPFYVRHSGWKPAVDLVAGDEIFTSLGGWLRVSGGTWTDRRTTVYNLEVDRTHTYFVGRMQAWVHNMCHTVKQSLGPYKEVGGHHVHAKAAFRGHPTYDPKKGFSISQEFMESRGWSHQDMTSTQRRLFDELAVNAEPNRLSTHTRIAVEALKSGGATEAEARKIVASSLNSLRKQGVRAPTRIPWND